MVRENVDPVIDDIFHSGRAGRQPEMQQRRYRMGYAPLHIRWHSSSSYFLALSASERVDRLVCFDVAHDRLDVFSRLSKWD